MKVPSQQYHPLEVRLSCKKGDPWLGLMDLNGHTGVGHMGPIVTSLELQAPVFENHKMDAPCGVGHVDDLVVDITGPWFSGAR
jgi:hypothetical protein